MSLGRVLRLASAVIGRRRDCAVPLVLGLGLCIGFPTATTHQDVASALAGRHSAGMTGQTFGPVADSINAVNLRFLDGITTGSSTAVASRDVGKAGSTDKKRYRERTPDEARVVGATKKGRLANIAPVTPPKAFSAGSIFQRTSSLLQPGLDGDIKLTFAKPAIRGQEVKIAMEFHGRKVKEKDKKPAVPAYLAELITNDKADVLATAYAPAEPDYAKASPFAALLKDEPADNGRFVPPLGKGDHAWLQQPLPASVFSDKEQACLANAVYFEARGESARGQAAVAQVVLNRVRNPAYPNTICDVVYQNKNWKNACQFSFACDGIPDRVWSQSNYRKAKEIAMAVTAGKIFIAEVGSSTHYYAQYVSPGWARAMKKMTKIGLHIFYRTKRGGWS